MKRSLKLCVVTLVVVVSLAVGLTTLASAQVNTIEIELVVSPNVLNLESKGGVVTLHADLDYGLVDVDDLKLKVYDNISVPIAYTFADNCGDLVIKCNLETVKGMVVEGDVTLTFQLSINNDMYTGEDTISVINS